MPYYKNGNVHVLPGVYGSELTHALDDSAQFFDGQPSNQQEVFDKLTKAAKVVSILRSNGFAVDIVRTFSEGAANHGSGYTMDVAPPSRSYSECYAMATEIKRYNMCSQIWIEASDDQGNFHVHFTYDPSENNTSPELKTILKKDGSDIRDGLKPEQETTYTELEENG